jgi:hypothetical protein
MMLLDIHSPHFELYGPNYYEVLIVISWFLFMGLILIAVADLTRIIKTRYLTMLIIGITAITNSYLHYESKKRTTCTYISTIVNQNGKAEKANFLCHHTGMRGGTNHECIRETVTYLHFMRRIISSECHNQ